MRLARGEGIGVDGGEGVGERRRAGRGFGRCRDRREEREVVHDSADAGFAACCRALRNIASILESLFFQACVCQRSQ